MVAKDEDLAVAPDCNICGEAMHYEHVHMGWSTFHTETGEFLCADEKKED